MKTIYLNLDDDIEKIVTRLQRERAADVVLVFPKKSFLFSDPLNLSLLKNEVDALDKNVSVLTMDEHGQEYARAAGFPLKVLAKHHGGRPSMDIRIRSHRPVARPADEPLRERMLKRMRPLATASVAIRDNIFDQPIAAVKRVNPRDLLVSRKFIAVILVTALVVASFLVFIIVPKATVTVYAKSQSLQRDLEVNLSTQFAEPSPSQLSMPAVRIDETRDVTSNFSTSGTREVGTKAQGKVKIYNLTGRPLSLKASTTTLSANGKTYTFTADQQQIRSVPANSADAPIADVIASAGGESSNLSAGTRLEITNQVFGNQPDRLYAVSSGISGGTSRFVAQINQKDLDDAKTVLQNNALKLILDDLTRRNEIIPEGGYNAAVEDFTTDKPVGTETPNFTAKGKVHLTGLAYRNDKLSELVRQRLLMTLTAGKRLQDPSKDSAAIKAKSLDLTAGTMVLTVHYESLATTQIDTTNVKDQIAGRSTGEATELLLANDDVDRVDIKVWPSWTNNVPRLTSRITVNAVQSE